MLSRWIDGRGAMALVAVATGCGGVEGAVPAGHSVAAITTVPNGVQCIRVTITRAGDAPVVVAATVMGRTEATIDLGVLAPGSTLFEGAAYESACADVTASTAARWTGAPVTLTVEQGRALTVPFVFRANLPARASVDFVPAIREVYSGALSYSTFALGDDGVVRAWGRNEGGALGIGSDTPRALRPIAVAGLPDTRHLSAGFNAGCAVDRAGGLRCWGALPNSASPPPTLALSPVLLPADAPYATVAVGRGTACALRDDTGTVACWGAREGGGFLSGQMAMQLAPEVNDAAWSASGGLLLSLWGGGSVGPSAFDGFCAHGSDRTAVCWGQARDAVRAQNSSGTIVQSAFPRSVQIAFGGGFGCAVDLQARVFCVGANGAGQLGIGNTTAQTAAVQVNLSNLTSVCAGQSHACALRGDGTVWCWGSNTSGQLGAAQFAGANRTVPTAVPGLANVTRITCGAAHTCALRGDGTLWCWGNNLHGQVGDGTRGDAFSPTQVRF